ncbi:MAG: GNAT family N-acetyltransferase [Dehalococcoidales bacterium]|jgi:ribosomal protein S18 acetylase RimI-like enzyme
MKDTGNITYIRTDEKDLELIAPLWRKLVQHHKERSPEVFKERFDNITFADRKCQLLAKSEGGAMLIDLAKDKATGELVGYCVSVISGNKEGEIESIYVAKEYRGGGIGDGLMKKALAWMDAGEVSRRVIAVAAGNEEVFSFYRRYGFYPRVSILTEQEKKPE